MKQGEIILAPFAGWSAPLAELPDAVFATAMMGEGAAIDPLERELRSPCDGEVISIAASRHAVALRTPAGAEILVHVGIDTVAFGGEGFEVRVAPGQRVRAGDTLLSFDLDRVARRAPSLFTPIIVTNVDRFRVRAARVHRAVRAGDVLFELEPLAPAVASPSAASASDVDVTRTVVVAHAHGIHARPAAQIARAAKTLTCEVEIRARGRGVSARSAMALMSLGVRGGDEIELAARGPAATQGIAALVEVLAGLDASAASEPAASAAAVAPIAQLSSEPLPPGQMRGVSASRGLAVGAAFFLTRGEIAVPEMGRGAAIETAAFERAASRLRTRLGALAATASSAARDILGAHLELLDDPELTRLTREQLAAGRSAGFAWRSALRASAAALEATGEARLGERIDDLADLEHQLLVELGAAPAARPDVPAGGILLARELAPSQFIELDTATLAGIALAGGGPTSHVAILAAAAGVPMLVALGPGLLSITPGTTVVLDADESRLHVAPDAAALATATARVEQRRARAAADRALASRDCHLASGERIEVFANLSGTLADASRAMAEGAEGCGLLRTEFLFLERATAPDEDEQLRCYQAVADTLRGKPLVIRTMDIGGDKPIPYLPLPPEENPALGLRGIRTSFWRPDLFDAQLRALLRVSPAGLCRVLLPMITEPAELRAVRARVETLRASLGVATPQIGVMIETPASAMLADSLAREADFLSIGTNDLTQYTLAMDRGHAELAPRIDGLHPAVLALIARVGEAGERHGRLVAVCGGLASDPVAAPVLVGLGVRELSVVPSAVPMLKARLATLTLERCRDLAARALALDDAGEVRRLARERLP